MATKTQTTKTKKAPKDKYGHLPTKSAKIRAMADDGMKRGDIAKALDIRYQHVRNVLVTPLKKS